MLKRKILISSLIEVIISKNLFKRNIIDTIHTIDKTINKINLNKILSSLLHHEIVSLLKFYVIYNLIFLNDANLIGLFLKRFIYQQIHFS